MRGIVINEKLLQEIKISDTLKSNRIKNLALRMAKPIGEILRWTRRHTFYTHFLCNQLYGSTGQKVDMHDLESAKYRCLQQFELTYLYYKKLLSPNQWKVTAAIAKEDMVEEVTAKDFLNKYNLSASSTHQAVKALVKDGILYEMLDNERVKYVVYDVFFSRWLQWMV